MLGFVHASFPSSLVLLVAAFLFLNLSIPALAVCGVDSGLVDIAPTLALSVCADWQPDSPSTTVIRVVRTPLTAQSTAANVTAFRDSVMVQPAWPKSTPKFKVDRSEGLLTITTTQVIARVELASLSIQFFDASSSDPFLTEQSHSFTPDIDAATGGASFVASCVWGPLADNEALYGGGSFQSGIIDFRNVPVNLVQFNTEV